jgi:hypothetical protein
MAKSKHRKKHKSKLANYKATKKREQEALKKKLMDEYIKMQQQTLDEKQAHTSTEEVSGPEIDIDELSQIDDVSTDVNLEVPEFEEINIEDSVVSGEDK